MKILVTGGAGFIGSHIVDRLLAEGHHVAVLDDFSNGRRENLNSALAAGDPVIYEMDVRSSSLGDVFAAENPEAVVHLAAQIDVRVSVRDPIHDADVNVLGTLNILERAREHGTRKVVVASSGGCVYGEARVLPIRETFRGRPESPYGISKRVLHDYLAFYRHTHGLDSTVLALSNVFGPRQDPYGEAGVVAMFIGAMLGGRETTIFGDGTQTRDFVFVADVADAFVRALGGASGKVLNIGTGMETSVLDLWNGCALAAGYGGEPRFAPPRAGELARVALDPSRARKVLGWSPAMPVAQGLRLTAEFIAKHRLRNEAPVSS